MTSKSFDPDRESNFVRRVLAADGDALEQLAKRLAFVARMLASRNRRFGSPLSRDEVDDVVQETFLVVWRRLREFVPYSPLESWVAGICVRTLQDAIRAKQRRHRQVQELAMEPPDESASVGKRRMDQAEAEVLLARLGGQEALVIRLKYLESMTFVEIGERLNIPVNTAKSDYYRGMKRIRSMRGGDDDARGEERSDAI